MVFSLSALWWRRIRGLWKFPDGRDWLRGKLGFVLLGRAMLSKSLIQFPVNGRGYVPSLLFDLRPNYGGGNEDNGSLLQKVPCTKTIQVWHKSNPLDYTVEVTNRFKGLDLIDRVPEELWMELHDFVQEAVIKTIPKKKKCKKAKWLSE